MQKNSGQPEFGRYSWGGFRLAVSRFSRSLPKNRFNFRLGLFLRKLSLDKKQKIVDAEVFGLKLRLYPFDNLGDRYVLFTPQYYESEEVSYMEHFLAADSVFVDIGANTGFYSLYAARKISQPGHILALEPNPEMYDRFITNIAFNQRQQTIVPLTTGVADRETSFTLSLDRVNLGGASIVQNYGKGGIEIRCKTLLQTLRENQISKIDLLKIDIEEAEPLVMNEFFKSAPKELYPRVIFIETDTGIDMAKAGYRFVKRTPSHNSIYELVG